MPKQHVLITGMSGLIGSVVRRHLQDDYKLRALNRSEVPGVEWHEAEFTLEEVCKRIVDLAYGREKGKERA